MKLQRLTTLRFTSYLPNEDTAVPSGQLFLYIN